MLFEEIIGKLGSVTEITQRQKDEWMFKLKVSGKTDYTA